MKSHTKISFLITCIFFIEWVFLAFNVNSRSAWLLENILVFIFVVPSIYFYAHGFISLTSYTLLILFASFHCLGAHYTYSLVPYEQWSEYILGISVNSIFGWKRNNYDRLVHFLWGFLFFKPFYELFRAKTRFEGLLPVSFSFLLIIGASAVYELLEWLVAVAFGGNLGTAYVGAQGDEWDAQKDQALAIFGMLLGFIVFYVRPIPSLRT